MCTTTHGIGSEKCVIYFVECNRNPWRGSRNVLHVFGRDDAMLDWSKVCLNKARFVSAKAMFASSEAKFASVEAMQFEGGEYV